MSRQKILGRVVRQYRKRAGLTQPQLSERSEVDQAAISRIENGKYEGPEVHLDALATAMGVRASQLLQAVEDTAAFGEEGVVAPPELPGYATVPLVGWVRAGKWDEVQNPFDADSAEGFVHTSAKVSRRAFALRVKGDSMTNPRGWPSFPPGTTIIVDPKASIEPGALVVAQVDENEEATFKKFASD
ncbi:MAG: LexA family protein, partial [Arenimonas sp.]